MRTFLFVLVVAIVAVYNLAGWVGVVALLLGLSAFAAGCAWGYAERYRDGIDNCGDNDDDCNGDDDDHDILTDEDIEVLVRDGERAIQEIKVVEITDLEWRKLLVELGLLGSDEACGDGLDNDCDGETDENEPKFMAMRRCRGQNWHGNEDRRASRLHPDNSWKAHRGHQWR